MAARSRLARIREWGFAGALVGVASLFLIAVALLWQAGEAHYQGCIARVSAAYPAIPVSAFVSRDKTAVGPLKVSFAAERTKALKTCHHL